ncbi:MAG: PAS domain S-box protein, partial [Verrucomicrobiaceae bacterium]|nr:PAS domain S-box protein [Verrucomicrobiaceae bacterium]
LHAWKERIAVLRQELSESKGEAQGQFLLADLKAVDAAMDEMIAESDLIFSFFTRNEADRAGERMATMDRKFAHVNTALARLRERVSMTQRQHLNAEQASAKALQKFEYLIALLILVMVAGATVYGRKMARTMRQSDQEICSLNEGLERRVEERTHALALANEQLSIAKAAAERVAQDNKQMIEHSLDIICSVDKEGRFVRVNGACERIWGYAADELKGRRYISLVHPDDVERTERTAAAVMAGTILQDFENRYVRKDGQVVNITWSARWSDEQQLIFCVARDVTEHKRAEEELQKLAQQNTLLLNSAGVGVHGLDREGRITFGNPFAAKLLGYEMGELSGKPAHPTMHHTRADGSAYPKADCPIHATLSDGVTRRVTDELFWRKDGSSFPVEYTSAPVCDEAGRVIGATVVFTDVAERKRAEKELRASETRFRSVTQSVAEAIISADPKGNIIFWNPAAERIFGRSEIEVLGEP